MTCRGGITLNEGIMGIIIFLFNFFKIGRIWDTAISYKQKNHDC